MKKPLHVAMSPITGTIFAGTLLKGERIWSTDKQDVTLEALIAVAQHVTNFGRPVEISKMNGTVEYRITVEYLPGKAEK